MKPGEIPIYDPTLHALVLQARFANRPALRDEALQKIGERLLTTITESSNSPSGEAGFFAREVRP